MKYYFFFLLLTLLLVSCENRHKPVRGYVSSSEGYNISLPKGWDGTLVHDDASGGQAYYMSAPITDEDPMTRIFIEKKSFPGV